MNIHRSERGAGTAGWLVVLAAAVLVVAVVWGASMWAGRTAGTGYATGESIAVEGCLTASADATRFALTPVELDPLGSALSRSATDTRPTFTYQLVGSAAALRPHVGEQVTIVGVVDEDVKADQEIEREQASPPMPHDEAYLPDPPPEAEVETTEKAEIEVRQMRVESVQASGRACLEQAPVGAVQPDPSR